jgi:hypothetical protein
MTSCQSEHYYLLFAIVWSFMVGAFVISRRDSTWPHGGHTLMHASVLTVTRGVH